MLTFGHGRLDRDELATLLTDAGVERVIDVRRFPGSKANEAAARGQVPDLLSELGIDYRWDERLGESTFHRGETHVSSSCPD